MEITENRGKSILSHAGIYAIGVFSSRLLMFLLVPLYSFYIAPDDYGYFDLCLNAVMLLGPVITLQMKDGALRFLLELQTGKENSESHKAQIISVIFRNIAINTVAVILIAALISLFIHVKFLWLSVSLGIVFSWYEVLLQVCRGLERNTIYALAGIICAFTICMVSLVLVVVFHAGIEGVFVGNIAGRIFGIILIVWKTKILKLCHRVSAVGRALNRNIVKYCLPLLAVNVLIWVMSSSNRFFIEHFLGLTDNGVFAVAQKFSVMFETIAFVIFQAWQEMAIKHYNDSDRNQVYSKMLDAYIWSLSVGAVLLSYGLKAFYPYIVGADYQSSVCYVFACMVVSLITYVAIFYDVAYQCAKQTHRSVYGLLLATIVALSANWILIPRLGLYGALLANGFAYLFLVLFRVRDSRKFWTLRIGRSAVLSCLILIFSFLLYSYIHTTGHSLLICGLFSIVYFMIMPMPVRQVVDKILLSKIKRKR